MTPPMVHSVPFAGRMSYCLIRCLQMVLASQGQDYPVPWLECVSGEPFGFIYVRGHEPVLAVDGYGYHLAGEHLLRTLHTHYTFTGSSGEDEALASLDNALLEGPVVAGMLDMGYLTYMPDHTYLRGSDHAVVVLQRRAGTVLVHDPDGYVATPLPLADFLLAWQRDIYTGKPYGLWRIGRQAEPPSSEEVWERTLARARENLARTDEAMGEGITLCYGPGAMRKLAADLAGQPERGLGALPYFSWRVSGQRCFDSSHFLRERLPEAAEVRWEQALIYGELQQASAAGERRRLPELLERLADHEAHFASLLE
jgi:hypothetical protein